MSAFALDGRPAVRRNEDAHAKPSAGSDQANGRTADIGQSGKFATARYRSSNGVQLMSSTGEVVRDVQANNPYYRITKWVLPAGATTGSPPCAFKSTIMAARTGRLLLRNGDGEKHLDLNPGQPVEIGRGADQELINTTEHDIELTMIEFK